MKIAIISADLSLELGYQELYLSRALGSLGHNVRLITTNAISENAKGIINKQHKVGIFNDEIMNVEIQRLKLYFKYRSIKLALNVKKTVNNYGPDVIL